MTTAGARAPPQWMKAEHNMMEARANATGMPTQTPSNWKWYVQAQIDANIPPDLVSQLFDAPKGLKGGGRVTRLGARENVERRKNLLGRVGLAGPRWTRGEMEKPKGEEKRGTYTGYVYTLEQQKRLGVDKYGNPQ